MRARHYMRSRKWHWHWIVSYMVTMCYVIHYIFKIREWDSIYMYIAFEKFILSMNNVRIQDRKRKCINQSNMRIYVTSKYLRKMLTEQYPHLSSRPTRLSSTMNRYCNVRVAKQSLCNFSERTAASTFDHLYDVKSLFCET